MKNKNEMNEMDALIDIIGQWIIRDEEKPGILNPVRLRQVQFANTVMERLTDGTNMKVTHILHQPFKGMGSVCVEGENLEILDCKWLARAIEFASNAEVYPLSNGKVRLVLTFHGLIKEINIQ